jgi:hypothetical protein
VTAFQLVGERCVLDKGLSLKPGILLADFNEWAKANGEEPAGDAAAKAEQHVG